MKQLLAYNYPIIKKTTQTEYSGNFAMGYNMWYIHIYIYMYSANALLKPVPHSVTLLRLNHPVWIGTGFLSFMLRDRAEPDVKHEILESFWLSPQVRRPITHIGFALSVLQYLTDSTKMHWWQNHLISSCCIFPGRPVGFICSLTAEQFAWENLLR